MPWPGSRFRNAVALRAAALQPADGTRLGVLRQERFVLTSGSGLGDEVCVYHDRVRESIVARLAPETLVTHHACLAETLAQSPEADAEQVAVHYHGANQYQPAGQHYQRAADQAASQLAFDRAARLYGLAIELLPLSVAERAPLLTKQADALANAGRGAEAARAYQAATEGAAGSQTLVLRRQAAYQFCISGHVDEGRAALAAVLRDAGFWLPNNPRAALVSLLWNRARLWLRGDRYQQRAEKDVAPAELARLDAAWTAAAGLSMFDVVAGADFQTRGCLLALRAGEPKRLARALAWEAAHTSNMGGTTWQRTERLLGQARQLAEQVDNPFAQGWTGLCAGIAHFTNGRWPQALALLEAAEWLLRERCTGVAWEIGTAHTFKLWTLLYLGEVKAMSEQSFALLQEARSRGDQYAATTHSAFSVPMGHLTAGDPRARGNRSPRRWRAGRKKAFTFSTSSRLMASTYIDLYEGRGTDAWERMQRQWPLAVGSQLLRVQVLRTFLTHLRARSALAAAPKGGIAPPRCCALYGGMPGSYFARTCLTAGPLPNIFWSVSQLRRAVRRRSRGVCPRSSPGTRTSA